MGKDFNGFFDGEGTEQDSRGEAGKNHVLTEAITLVRSALNILEMIYDYYNGKRKE